MKKAKTKLMWTLLALAASSMGVHAPVKAQSQIPCLIIGDSIALGVAQFAEGCYTAAQNGLKSPQWLKQWQHLPNAKKVLIALGTNDTSAGDAEEALEEIRKRLQQTGSEVIWIAPDQRFPGRKAVVKVAAQFADVVYESPKENLGKDKIHYTTTGYKRMAAALKN